MAWRLWCFAWWFAWGFETLYCVKRPTGGQTAVQTMTKQAWLVCRVYYLVTYMWQMSVYIVFMAVFAIFGSAIGLKMFTKNSWGVQVNILHVHMQK